MSAIAGWTHPVLGLVAVALVVLAASRAARVRQGGPGAAPARARHRRLAPRALAAVVVAWCTGLLAVRLLHDEIDPATSGHFRAGSVVLLLLVVNALLARRFRDDARARLLHPWIGAAAVLATALQIFLGMQLLRR